MEIDMLTADNIASLNARAKIANPRSWNWYSQRNGSHRRTYHCNICDALIDTESSKYGPTVHAEKSLRAHALEHLSEMVS